MRIVFISPCGNFEGSVVELKLSTGVVRYLITDSGAFYKFIGNQRALALCVNSDIGALIYGECKVSKHNRVNLEVIEVKPLYNHESKLMSNLDGHQIKAVENHISLPFV